MNEAIHPHQDAEFVATEAAEEVEDLYPMAPSGVITDCPKCGADEGAIKTEFHDGGRLNGPCGARFGWPDVQYIGEHVCRSCRRCAFGWPEKVAHAGV